MNKIILASFLISFTFILNEVLVFGQNNIYSSVKQQQSTDSDDDLMDILKNKDDRLDANAAWAQSREMDLLRYFKAQLEAESNSDLEERVEEIQNVLNKTTDMFCTIDEDAINDQGVKLNLELDRVLDKYTEIFNAPQSIRNDLIKKEMQLRQKIIKAIDDSLSNNGQCDDNVAPPFSTEM